MKEIFGKHKALRQYAGGVWVDGSIAYVGVAVGESEQDRRRVVEIVECAPDEVPQAVTTVERTLGVPDSSSIRWLIPLRADECIIESCLIPKEVAGSPDETRALACLGGTPWGDPETTEAMQLALGFQIENESCFIAAASYGSLLAACELVPARDVAVTAEALAFAQLVQTAHPAIRSATTVVVGILGSRRSASFVIFDRGCLVMARQCDLSSAMRKSARVVEDRVAPGAHAEEYEFDSTYSGVPHSTDWQPKSEAVDGGTWRAAMLAALRETLTIFAESGGYVSEIGSILVAGDGAEAYDLRAVLPQALGFEIDVLDVESSRVVTTNDSDLARRIAESEPALTGILSLLSCARKPNVLTFPVGTDDEMDSAGPSRRNRVGLPTLSTKNRTALAAAALALSLVGGFAGLRQHFVSRSTADAERRLEVETNRATELRAIAAERYENAARLQRTEELLQAIDALRTRQQAPVRFLADVRRLLPEGANLFELTLDRSDATITGGSSDLEAGTQLALRAQNASDAFSDVVPSTRVESLEVHVPDEDPTTRPYLKFSVKARFLPAVPNEAESRLTGKK